MRRAITVLLLLLLISFSASAAEGSPAEVKFDLVLEPAGDILPGDRIYRSIVLENLTEKQLNFTVSSVNCSGETALLQALTLTLVQETEAEAEAKDVILLSEQTDRLQGQTLNLPFAVCIEAAGKVKIGLFLDFDPEATAELMGTEARIVIGISGQEMTGIGDADKRDSSARVGSDAELENDAGVSGVPDTQHSDGAVVSAEGKESVGERTGSGETIYADGEIRNVIPVKVIQFAAGPKEDISEQRDVLEAEGDPIEIRSTETTAENTKNSADADRAAENDSRLADLRRRFQKQLDAFLKGKTAETEAVVENRSDDRRLSVYAEETEQNDICVRQAQSVYGSEAVTIYLGEAEMKSKVRNVMSAVGNLFLWLLIFCAVYAALSAYQERKTGKPAFFMGYKPVMILSESMEPTYPQGSIVLVRKQKRSAETGDVVMFSPGEEDGYVIHRIVGESEDGFITRGDHNNTEDRGTIEAEQIYGTVIRILW